MGVNNETMYGDKSAWQGGKPSWEQRMLLERAKFRDVLRVYADSSNWFWDEEHGGWSFHPNRKSGNWYAEDPFKLAQSILEVE